MPKITQYGSPVLRTATEPIEEIMPRHVALVNRMKWVLSQAKGYGLAAPQVGASEPIFIYEDAGTYKTIVNPTLYDYDDSLWLFDEGCLSIPGRTFPIWRPKRVLLRGLDITGAEIKIEAVDLLARIFQHEMDHLNGKLVIDQLSSEERDEFEASWKPPKPKPKKKRRK